METLMYLKRYLLDKTKVEYFSILLLCIWNISHSILNCLQPYCIKYYLDVTKGNFSMSICKLNRHQTKKQLPLLTYARF